MKVLVTGARGFTGHYVVENLLARGYCVHPLQSNLTDREALKLELAPLDLDAVIHLAAISNVSHDNASAYCQVNVVGTCNLLEFLSLKSGLQSVLLASSGQIYGHGPHGALEQGAKEPLMEADHANPQNGYAVSKYAMELVARLWAAKLPILVTRPFNYTGVGQSTNFIIPKIVDHFKRRAPVMEVGNIELYREFADVRDVVEYYSRLIELPVNSFANGGGVVNICTQKPVRLSDIVRLCSSFTQHEIELHVNQSFVRVGEPEMLIGDRSHLHSLVNIDPAFSLEDTLKWMLSA